MKVMINRLIDDDFDWLNGWMWDRSRAIRVELNKNYRLPEDNEVYVRIYEMCIRFHLVSMQQMSKSKALGKDYDRHTDWEQLGAACNQMKELWDKIKVYMPQDGKTPSPLEASRVAEIHAYNIIVGLKEPDHREAVRRHPRVRTAQAIVRLAQDSKNPSAFWSLVRSNRVSYLLACAAATRFNAVRVDTLEAMVKAYMVHKQKVDELTLVKLVDMLGFDNQDQVKSFCAEFGGEFETDHQNITRLRPETLTIRHDPSILNKQYFSQKYVEFKRGGRNLAAILLGYNMGDAGSEGMVETISDEDEDSLFVPESSAPSNPFAAAASTAQTTGQASPFAKPGLFDPSKDTIKFSTPSNASGVTNPFAGAAAKSSNNGQSTTPAPATGANPFAPFAAKNPAASLSVNGFGTPAPAASFPTPAASNSFTKTAIPNTFATLGTTTAPSAPGATPAFSLSAGSSAGFTGFSSLKPTNSLTGDVASAATSTGLTGFPKLPTFSSTPSLTPKIPGTPAAAPLFATPSQPLAASPNEDKKQKEAEEVQRKAKEEEARKAQEERERVAEEQRRKAEEERQRKIQEEQAKALVAEQQRRLREEKEAERIRLENEAARKAEVERQKALEVMGRNLFQDPKEGFMTQYLQHLTTIIAQETMKTIEAEQDARDNALADRMAQERRVRLVRMAFYKWCHVIESKRKKAEALRRRERRRRFKAEVKERRSSKASSAISPQALEVQPVGEVPEERPLANSTKGPTSNRSAMSPPKTRKPQKAARSVRPSSEISNGDFSQSYYDARAESRINQAMQPIVDRTETNYFKLLAMGVDRATARDLTIDSGNALKRSFGSTEGEDAPPTESSKRVRRSPSSLFETPDRPRRSLPPTTHPSSALRQSLPVPVDDEERVARYRAIKASLVRSGHRPSQSIDGSRTFRDSVSRQSTPFGNSTTRNPEERPKYWARESRFVPQHLYGQPDAIREYRRQVNAKSPSSSFAASEPQGRAPDPPGFLLSSPVPAVERKEEIVAQTQMRDLPERSAAAVVIDDDADEEDGGELDTEIEVEGEEWDGYDDNIGDDFGGEEEEELFYDEDAKDEVLNSEDDDLSDDIEEEEEDYDDDDDDDGVQRPGATQDDAIELSD